MITMLKLFSKLIFLGLSSYAVMGCMTKPVQKDSYLWLEEIASEESLAWANSRSQKTLKSFQADPRFEEIQTQALSILSASDKIPLIQFEKDFVYNIWTDRKNPRGVYRRTTYADYKNKNPKWEILIDIDQLGKNEGKSWVFKGCTAFRPNPTRCMMMLSDGGKDAYEAREFDLVTKDFVQNGFFIPLAKTSLTWLDAATLLVATDFGPGTLTESGYPRQVKILKRGQSVSEAEMIYEMSEKDFRAYAYSQCTFQSCEAFIVRNLDFYHHEYFWLQNNRELSKIEIPQTADLHGFFQNQVYFSLKQNLNEFKSGSLLRCAFGAWSQAEAVYVPTATSTLENVFFSKDQIYLDVFENVNRRIYKFGKNSELLPFPVPSVGNTTVAAVNPFSNQALFSFSNSIIQPTLYEWVSEKKIRKIKSSPARFDGSNLVVEQYQATSFDGVQIPYFIVRDKTKSGPRPTLMTAYGGFQISIYPYYDGVQGKVWLEKGGQFVIANIRGGGEFGPRWHEAAMKQNRQVAFNDLFAVTEEIIKKGFTTSDRLALMGGSNGGLLAGVALTQRPELYKAILINSPLLDMLRYHKLSAGSSWIGEYGDPEIKQERAALEKYSPYQNIRKDKQYPSIFLSTSAFDDRVHPGHARKFAAKLEEYQIPFEYFENTEGGHSNSADLLQRARYFGLLYTFLFKQIF